MMNDFFRFFLVFRERRHMRERDSFFHVYWRVRREHGFLVSLERVWKNDF